MRPFNGCIDSDMNKAILTSISLFVAACGILIARRVCVHGPVRYASSVTLAPSEAPTLKEWINNSIDEDMPPGYVPRYQWAADTERAQLESVWANAATNLLQGNIHGMKECVATVSERMKSIAPEQFYGIVRPCYDMLKSEFMARVLSRSYTSTDKFKERFLLDIEGMNVLGNIELSSEQIPLHCAYLEADALAMARRAVKKFAEEGRDDFLSVARELEEMLIDQIESEYGLTRRYMKLDLKMQMLLYERGYSTRENVIRGVRTDAWHLENTAGYIPKWQEEFK